MTRFFNKILIAAAASGLMVSSTSAYAHWHVRAAYYPGGHGYYSPPYFYPNYWFPDYYYYYYTPYVQPVGAWRVFEQDVKSLEKSVDNLKHIAKSEHANRDMTKQVDHAVDQLNDELSAHGIYSPDYLAVLLQNVNYHMNALESTLASNRGALAQSFSLCAQILDKVNQDYDSTRP